MTEHVVFGADNPSDFAVYGGRVFTPSANGIVVTRSDGSESFFWRPTNGLYGISNLAVSAKGVLCFNERRLNVSLHFYNAADLRRLQELTDIAKVSLQSVAFDSGGELLYVLSTMPSCTVKVFAASHYGGFTLSQCVPVSSHFSKCGLIPTGAGFLLSRDNVVGGFAPQADGQLVECFDLTPSLQAGNLNVTAAACPDGGTVIYATADGKVYRYRSAESEAVPEFVFQWEGHDDGVAALYASVEDNTLYVSYESGAFIQVAFGEGDQAARVIYAHELPFCVRRIALADDSVTAFILGTDYGLYKLDMEDSSADSTVVTSIRHCLGGDVLNCHTTRDGKHVIAVSSDGGYMVTDLASDVHYYYELHCPADTKDKSSTALSRKAILDSCLANDMLVMIHSGDHRATVHDPLTGTLLTTLPYGYEEAKPTKCVSNPAGFLIVFDERCVFFYSPSPTEGDCLLPCGFFVAAHLAMMSSIISLACGLPAPSGSTEEGHAKEEGCFLVACSSGEIYLVKTPVTPTGAHAVETEHSVEQVLLGMWRVDFPLVSLCPCYVDADIINIVVHSLDKDTKLYALDRRHGKDPKETTVRPYFLMRDHESGGRCLSMLRNGTTLCSAGKDGRIVLRDVAPYQKKLTPIPPSKEKRKAIGEATVWYFADGGLTSIAVTNENRIVCVGGSPTSVLKVLNAPLPKKAANREDRSWKELEWHLRESSENTEADKDAHNRVGGGPSVMPPTEVDAYRKEVATQIEQLRAEWTEQMKSLGDVDVAVDDLLLANEKNQFQESCADAVFEMREDEYYAQLENQYMQDVIKRRCCQTMEVPLAKVASLAAPALEVYNFHIAKQCRPRVRVAKKLGFLRSLQNKAAAAAAATANGCGGGGFSFQQRHKHLQSTTTMASAGGSTESSKNSNRLTSAVEGEAAAALKQALYASCDVYTRGRASLQAGLLRGLVVSLKDVFNQEFTLLKQKKQSTLALIDERTQRCVQILKQLGDVTGSSSSGGGSDDLNVTTMQALFAARFDAEEDPSTLFSVHDSELDADIRALLPQKQGATVYSPENEAALKLWMDGLEKDVEVVRVTLMVPDFADENKEAFVPLDERTDEQVRLYEEYEKRLREETEAVEARKGALRNELKSLQKLNRTCAQELDESLGLLRSRRIATAERIDETELQVVQLTQQWLKPEDTFRAFDAVEKTRKSFLKRAQHLEVAVKAKQSAVAAAIEAADGAAEETEQYAEEALEMAPFQDETHGEKLLRRFGRWKRKFDDGKGDVPSVAKSPDDCPRELWEDFCEHCERLLSLREKATKAEQFRQAEEEALQTLELDRASLLCRSEEAEADEQHIAAGLLPELIDTAALYSLHQGQVQDETAAVTSDFCSSRLRWTRDVAQYNDLVLMSAAESGKLRNTIEKRRRRMKELAFETKRLHYCVGTLRLELRQLHTLRVTRFMQEWLTGDADVSEDKAVAKIDDHIAYVNGNMRRKIDDLEKAAVRFRSQLSERATENAIISREVNKLQTSVRDATTIQSLIHVDGTGEFAQRAREIYETSELEELARSQQEELIRLKKTVDALRERTFPSFAIVSKQKM